MANKQSDIKVGVVTSFDGKGLDQGKTGLAGFKQSIADADGAGGKLQAGFAGVKDAVVKNAGLLAVGAGSALVGFGIKAVGAFTDTAKAALDLGGATGLAVEDASRWIAIGDDFGVGADQLAGGIGKIAKSLEEPKWAQFGIATHDAAGQARNANDILTDSLVVLSGITNETERARVGNQLFGKGYSNLAPLIGHTREEYEGMLGAVEKGQVVTKQEADKAEKFRLAEDQLGDALHEVTLQIGQQVAGLAPLIIALAKVIGLTAEAFGPGGLGGSGFRETTDAMRGMREEIEAAGLDFGDLEQKVIAEGLSVEELTEIVTTAREEHDKLHGTLREGEKSWEMQTEWLDKAAIAASETDRETRKLSGTMSEFPEKVKKSVHQVDRFAEKLAEADLAYQRLTGKLDEEEAWDHVNESMKEFGENTEHTSEEVRDQTRDIAEYVVHTDTIPASKKTEILALLDKGKLDEATALLDEVSKNREILLTIKAAGSADIIANLGSKGAKASGGPTTAGNYLVGEQGPEIIHLNGSGYVSDNADVRRMFSGETNVTITNNFPIGTSAPRAIAEIARRYKRRTGRIMGL